MDDTTTLEVRCDQCGRGCGSTIVYTGGQAICALCSSANVGREDPRHELRDALHNEAARADRAERDLAESRAQVERLREALREHMVVSGTSRENGGSFMHCLLCWGQTPHGKYAAEDVEHQENCPASPLSSTPSPPPGPADVRVGLLEEVARAARAVVARHFSGVFLDVMLAEEPADALKGALAKLDQQGGKG